jgi:hypothetical protein
MFNLPVDTSAMAFIVGGRTEPVFERGTDRPKVDQGTASRCSRSSSSPWPRAARTC